MQNGTFPWMASSSLGQKTWHPGYQASLSDLFLKKNPLHFGAGISQLVSASSYLEKISPPQDQLQKCPHSDGKDKPCEACHQYISMLRSDGNASSGSSRPSISTPVSMGSPTDRKNMAFPGFSPSMNHVDRPMNGTTMVPPRPRPPTNKQFICPVCHKLFTQKGNLKTHMMIHTGEKPYACQVCGKSFTQKGNVDTHMKIHTGEKDYGCDMCGKRFTQKGNLKTHIRSVHTKEKPFACSLCGKSFSQKGNVMTHLRTHNKDDRFPCTMCGKTFSQKGNLKTHMQRHTGQIQSKRNYNNRMGGNPNGVRRIPQLNAHMNPFNFHSSPVLGPAGINSSLNSPFNHKSLFSKMTSGSQGLDMARGINLSFPPQDTHSDNCKSPETPPMPLISDSGGIVGNSNQSYHNPSSPSPSQLSSSSPVDELGMAHIMSDKAPSHSPTPKHHNGHSPNVSDCKAAGSPPMPNVHQESEGRPFYSAPSTPIPGPFSPTARWNRYYDGGFQPHPSFGSYNAIAPHTTPLSKLSLLASGSMAGQNSLSQHHQQNGDKQHGHEQQFPSVANPDFSQLLD